MMMLIAFLAGLGFTAMIGVPMLMVSGRITRTRRPRSRDHDGSGPPPVAVRAFEPLKMEPFELRWPSEVVRAPSTTLALKWPSEGWNDPDFGQTAADLARMEAEAERANARAATLSGVAAQAPPPRRQPKVEKATPKQPKTPKHKKQRSPKNDAEAEFFSAQRAPGVPDAAEVADMVQQIGLAATVEEIRNRTGWDFKQAAEHLAQALRER